MTLSNKLTLPLMQTTWSAELNPFIKNPLNNVSILRDVKLNNGVTVINHLLGKLQQGWFLVDQDAKASVYRSAPLNALTLTLTSDSIVTVNIGVF